MIARHVLAATAALAFLMTALAAPAAAHASGTTEDGAYRITWGFLDEPAYTHQKNRLDLIIRDNATGAGVEGLTANDLTLELVKGEERYDLGDLRAYRGAKGANAGVGNYTTANPVYLTDPGIYALHVKGDIRGSAVDVTIPAAHAYEPMSEIAFPGEAAFGGGSDTSALEARIAELEAAVAALQAEAQAQATTPASVTPQDTNPVPAPALGLVALAIVALALALRRRG